MAQVEAVSDRARVDRIARIFKEVDWLVPTVLSAGPLEQFANALEHIEPSKKLHFLQAVLSLTYTPDYLSRMFVEQYTKIMHVRDYSTQIDEALRAYFSGFKYVAVTGLVPVIEGIVRKMAIRQNRNVGSGTQKLILEFDALVKREKKSSPHCYDERLAVLEGLRDFIKDRFLQNTNSYNGLEEFNRHGILHGIFENYGKDNNFL